MLKIVARLGLNSISTKILHSGLSDIESFERWENI